MHEHHRIHPRQHIQPLRQAGGKDIGDKRHGRIHHVLRILPGPAVVHALVAEESLADKPPQVALGKEPAFRLQTVREGGWPRDTHDGRVDGVGVFQIGAIGLGLRFEEGQLGVFRRVRQLRRVEGVPDLPHILSPVVVGVGGDGGIDALFDGVEGPASVTGVNDPKSAREENIGEETGGGWGATGGREPRGASKEEEHV